MSVDSISAAHPPLAVYPTRTHAAQPAPAPAPPAADPDHDGDVDPAGHVDVKV